MLSIKYKLPTIGLLGLLFIAPLYAAAQAKERDAKYKTEYEKEPSSCQSMASKRIEVNLDPKARGLDLCGACIPTMTLPKSYRQQGYHLSSTGDRIICHLCDDELRTSEFCKQECNEERSLNKRSLAIMIRNHLIGSNQRRWDNHPFVNLPSFKDIIYLPIRKTIREPSLKHFLLRYSMTYNTISFHTLEPLHWIEVTLQVIAERLWNELGRSWADSLYANALDSWYYYNDNSPTNQHRPRKCSAQPSWIELLLSKPSIRFACNQHLLALMTHCSDDSAFISWPPQEDGYEEHMLHYQNKYIGFTMTFNFGVGKLSWVVSHYPEARKEKPSSRIYFPGHKRERIAVKNHIKKLLLEQQLKALAQGLAILIEKLRDNYNRNFLEYLLGIISSYGIVDDGIVSCTLLKPPYHSLSALRNSHRKVLRYKLWAQSISQETDTFMAATEKIHTSLSKRISKV